MISYSFKEDKEKIMNFLQTGIFTNEQLFQTILEKINQGKIQAAFDDALAAEKKKYIGIMFDLATVF